MKKINNLINNHPIYLLIIIICLVFLPSAIVAKPQSESKLIVRALGIDKVGEEYEISAIAFLPKASQSFTENYKIVEGKGKTLYEAIASATKETGKDVGLAHTGIVFVNDELCKQGLVESMDFLVRDYSLGNNTFVVYVPDSTKEMIKLTNSLALSSGIRVADVADYDEEKILHGQSNIESIYDSAYSKSKCSLLSVMEISETEGLSVEGQPSGNEESSGAGGTEGEKEKKILNSGKILVLKSGKKALLLEEEEADFYKWTRNSKFSDILIIENFSDEKFDNAILTFTVKSNDVNYDLSFENNIPVCTLTINPTLILMEANQKNTDSDISLFASIEPTGKLKETINNKIKTEVEQILEKFKTLNLDVNKVYEKFYASKTKQFKQFLNTLENKEDYLSEIVFKVVVKSEIN